jgi:hypothetical protein
MSHRNNKLPLWDFQTDQQQLSNFKNQLYTPMRNNEVSLLYAQVRMPSRSSLSLTVWTMDVLSSATSWER